MSKTFTISRKVHKKGDKGSHNSDGKRDKRGISNQQVCVMCAIGGIGVPICKGRMKHTDLERLFKDRMRKNLFFVLT